MNSGKSSILAPQSSARQILSCSARFLKRALEVRRYVAAVFRPAAVPCLVRPGSQVAKSIRPQSPSSYIILASTEMFHKRTFDPILAAALSFWMAAAACVIGCMQPVLADATAQGAPQDEASI